MKLRYALVVKSVIPLVSAFFALSLVPAPAKALPQGTHRDISSEACSKQKLPSEFCASVGIAAYNVDHFEWEDLAAHAQPEAGASKCQSANAAVARVRTLAQEMRTIAEGSTGYDPALAVAVGRALHTIQDNCAHSGMPNPEHAWFSLSDSCLDTESSPDIQPEAIACAAAETLTAMEAFASAIQVPTPPPDPGGRGSSSQTDPQFWPPRGGVCDFLKSAPTWDGVDRRWNNELVVPALRDQLYLNLVVDPIAPASDVCTNGEAALEPATPVANVDTSQPIEWCKSIKLYCAGKTDDATTAPPWENGPVAPGTSTPSNEGSSCSFSRDSGGVPSWLLGLALTALLARARRFGR